MEVHIDSYGTLVKLKHQRLVVKDRESYSEVPLEKISSVYLGEFGCITTAALMRLIDKNIPVYFASRDAIVGAAVSFNDTSRPSILRAQLQLSEAMKFKIAARIIAAKIRNQDACLQLLKKSGAIEYESCLAEAIGSINSMEYSGEWKQKLMFIESDFARSYWNTLRQVIPDFQNREKRGAMHYFNAMLNYSYAILSSRVRTALVMAGLEPSIPIFHREEDWKLGLVYDLMEVYRPIVDKSMISLITLNVFKRELDFDEQLMKLNVSGKRKVVSALTELFSKQKKYNDAALPFFHIIREDAQNLRQAIVEGREFYPYIWGIH